MNRFILVSISILTMLCNASADAEVNISFEGSVRKVIEDRPAASTGLDAVYTVYDIKEVSEIRISGLNASEAKAQMFSNLGGGYAVDIPIAISGQDIVISTPSGDSGYIIESANSKYCFWIVNYAEKIFDIVSVEAYPEQDCDMTRLSVSGKGDAIHYYSINGRQCTLSRDIEASFTTLEWDDEQKNYVTVEKKVSFEYLQSPLIIRPPFYTNTSVQISGDRFLRQWGMGLSVESPLIVANGLAVQTEAVQTNTSEEDDNLNMIKGDDSMLGGSAPADFVFYAYPTDAVIHNEWQLADDPDFEYIRYRFNEQNLTYTFDQEGQYYVRYVGSNSDGSCEVVGDTYEIGIGASDLRIPNAFSPDGDGINDEWKVGYRSLIEFKCWIFDRNGRQLHYFDRPEQGWDGKHKGKTVSPGVYYYVIEAVGADGKKYKKGGDINIIRYRKIGNSHNSTL